MYDGKIWATTNNNEDSREVKDSTFTFILTVKQ